ncbi:MAG: ATP-binding protein [Actinomycetota bacterium]|nr:ATP-binding protein [Actinomycetota bacterium]
MKRARSFSAEPQSVGAARRFAVAALDDAPLDVLEAVKLMVSELATNSIRHAETGFQLTICRAQGAIRVEVTDHAGGTPVMRSPGPEDPSGRGLRIVAMLSEAWGVDRAAAVGKTVWFTLSAAAPS